MRHVLKIGLFGFVATLWLSFPTYAHADFIITPIALAIAALGVTTLTAGAIATSIVTAVVGGIVSAGLGLAASALTGGAAKRKSRQALTSVADRSQQIITNVTGTVENVPVVYGLARVGGIRVYIDVGIENRLNQVVVFSEGPIQGFSKFFVDGNEYQTTNPANQYYGVVTIRELLGQVNQQFSSDVFDWTRNAINASHNFSGFACLYTNAPKNTDKFPSIPVLTAEVQGRLVYDPRNQTTTYSTNPALCIMDYLHSPVYGGNVSLEELDLPSFIETANHCDELVSNGNGGTQKRYELNGFVDTKNSISTNIEEMLTSCNSVLFHAQGKYFLRAMKAEVPVGTITESDIIGGVNVSLEGKRFKFNQVKVQYLNPSANWTADVAEYNNAAFLNEDRGEVLSFDLDLPYTTNKTTAFQLAELACKQSRLNMKVDVKCKQSVLRYSIGDVVNLNYPLYGWEPILLRLIGITIEPDGNVILSFEEYDDDVYTPGEVQPQELGASTSFKNPSQVTPGGVPSVQESLYDSLGSAGLKIKADLTWAESTDPFVSKYAVEHLAPDELVWVPIGYTTTPNLAVFDLKKGVNRFRVKAINRFDYASEFVETAYEIKGLTAPPQDIQGLGLITLGKTAILTWAPVSDLDVKFGGFIEVRHVPDGNTQWGSSIFITRTPGSATSVAVPLLDGAYLLRAVDSSEKLSVNTAVITATGTFLNALTLQGTLALQPSFIGTKTNTIVDSGILKLDSEGDFDALPGLFDDLTNSLDSYGGIYATGSYYGTPYLDLGTVKNVTLVLNAQANAVDNAGDFDAIPGLFDDIPTLDFDGVDVTAAKSTYYFRTTNDNPAGTPTWSDWRAFLVTDVTCRALQGGVVLESTNQALNLELATFEIKAYA